MTEEERKAYAAVAARMEHLANDEWCTCGHRRTRHESTLSWGHGDCMVEECECMKFTWTDEAPKTERY